jgi:hypothetical protein
MAQTTPLAAGTAAATSADIAVTTAAPVNLGLFSTGNAPLPTYPSVTIERKDPNGAYRSTGISLSRAQPDVLLNAPGTYRLNRGDLTQPGINPGVIAVGVMQDA